MTPEREKEIRMWVEMRYGADARKVFDCFRELLAEVDSLRKQVRYLAEQSLPEDLRFEKWISERIKQTKNGKFNANI